MNVLSADPADDIEAPTPEQLTLQAKHLHPYSSADGRGWHFSLDVVQQPRRARMCGFGDKDRRPITPPPCVQLVVKDKQTGKDVDPSEIEHTLYVLNVDLWSEDALREVNLVRHTTPQISISATMPTSLSQAQVQVQADRTVIFGGHSVQALVDRPGPFGGESVGEQSPIQTHGAPAFPPYPSPHYPEQASPYSPQCYSGHESRSELPHSLPHAATGSTQYPSGCSTSSRAPIGTSQRRMSSISSSSMPQGMFTRNLIGSLAASAFRLSDLEDRIGIWFILQDLSVRSEGNFRLRFSFVNVAAPTTSNGQENGSGPGAVNQGRAPVLASVFSEVFQVFSAKKFPGVCESTALSKCFATQGIKIPIRKEGPHRGAQDDDDYE